MKTTLTLLPMPNGITRADMSKIASVINKYGVTEVDVTISKHIIKRSNPQNAYLHGVIIPLVTEGIKEHGNEITQQQTKDLLKQMFLSHDMPISEDGECVAIQKNTSALTTVEFNTFVEDVQRWSAEMLGIIIPDPNEQLSFKQ